MSMRLTLATLLTIGILAPAAVAQTTARPARKDQAQSRVGIDARQRIQERRIEAGMKRGVINAGEARRLQGMQKRLSTLEQRLRTSDGTFSVRERARLNQMLNQLNRAIARAGRR